MVSAIMDGMHIELDENGFMMDPDLWNEDVAKALAQAAEICELTDDHWKVISYVRAYYRQYHIAPMINLICSTTGFSLDYVYRLFPQGPALGACRVAGLPKATGCV